VPPLWATFAKVARRSAGRRAAQGGGWTGLHVIAGLTSQTDGRTSAPLRRRLAGGISSAVSLLLFLSCLAFFLLLLLLLSSNNRVTRQFPLKPLTVSLVFPRAADPREHLFKEK